MRASEKHADVGHPESQDAMRNSSDLAGHRFCTVARDGPLQRLNQCQVGTALSTSQSNDSRNFPKRDVLSSKEEPHIQCQQHGKFHRVWFKTVEDATRKVKRKGSDKAPLNES